MNFISMWNCQQNSNKQHLKNMKLQFYKVMAAPVLLYGCENWVRSQKDISTVC